jgi:hypothetical protein
MRELIAITAQAAVATRFFVASASATHAVESGFQAALEQALAFKLRHQACAASNAVIKDERWK